MYDLREVKAISLREVAESRGIKLQQKGDRLWGKLRPEDDTPSFSINLKANLWYDFGAGRGGSVIDLVAELDGISSKAAINRLAEEYGLSGGDSKEWRPLTDAQYREIGIQPERATMNFNFDLLKDSFDYVRAVSEKYGISVQELSERYPKTYNKLLDKVATGYLNELKEAYIAKVSRFQKAAVGDFMKLYDGETGRADGEDINRRVDLLQRAYKPLYGGQKADLRHLKVSPEKDFIQSNQSTAPGVESEQRQRVQLVGAYKSLFNTTVIESFSADQLQALSDVNAAFAKGANTYLSIESIRKAYEMLGQKIESLQTGGAADSIMEKAKELFEKCNSVLEGVRNAAKTAQRDITPARDKARANDRSEELF